jgi:hypothetical protein
VQRRLSLPVFPDILGRLVWRGLRGGAAVRVVTTFVCHRLALAPVSALATVEALCARKMKFVVTDKSGARHVEQQGPSLTSLFLFVCAVLMVPAACQEEWLVLAALLVLMTPFPTAFATAHSLGRYRAAITLPQTGAKA